MIKFLRQLDNFQYKHRPIGFLVAVVRRYSSDRASRQAALMTYYLFMSLFPLMLLLSLLSNLLNRYNPGAANTLIHGATNYFPVLGQQLLKIAHSNHSSVSGMVISGLIALYGVRGTASVFRSIVNDIWGVPDNERVGFPQNWLHGLWIILIGGGGFVATSAATSWALGQGHGNLFRVLVTVAGIVLLTVVFVAILKLSLPTSIRLNRLISGAFLMSLALSLLQFVGGYIVTHDLKHYTDAYTAIFATTLGLLAWIYLVAQALLYSIEIAVIADRHLWPRHILKAD